MTSLWLDHVRLPGSGPLPAGARFDVVVVGAGLTGLVTALLLARGGLGVAIIEARFPGAVTTGNTTGKLSLLQGTRLSEITRRHSVAAARDYVTLNREGQQWLLRYCHEHSVAVQEAAAVTYGHRPDSRWLIEREYRASREAGLPAELLTSMDTPFPSFSGVRLAGQAQLDPVPLVAALTADALRHGAQLFQDTRVRAVHAKAGAGHTVVTPHGEVTAGTVVLATGTPILDRGGFFARLAAQRSHVVAFEPGGPVPDDMYLSADQPVRSLRWALGPAGRLLIVGGNGHPTGRARSPRSAMGDLIAWTQRYFPGAQPTHQWSAQDYSPAGGLPFAGPLLPGGGRLLVATGYAKWGLANAAAAALALTARIFGKRLPGAEIFDSWRPRELASLPAVVKANGSVALELAQGWSAIAAHSSPAAPAEGCGHTGRQGWHPVAVSTVGGQTRAVSAVCPHLGGIVRWNDAELSWDCPLHGSRFGAGGEVLEGPAVSPLAPLPAPD